VSHLVGGIVDQDIEMPELANGPIDQLLAMLFALNVTGDQHCAASSFTHDTRGFSGVRVRVEIGNQDIGALSREGKGDCPSDPTVGSRHERGATFEAPRPLVRIFAVIRRRDHPGFEPGMWLVLFRKGGLVTGITRILNGRWPEHEHLPHRDELAGTSARQCRLKMQV
jgi:hypothetical protein